MGALKSSCLLGAAAACLAVGLGACSSSEPEVGTGLVAEGPAQPTLQWRKRSDTVESAPIALTASDGTGLQLVSVSSRTVIEDPLAFTELQLVFHNPEARRREGRFEIALPEGASVSRFAMRIGERWQEGEVVERKRAQQVYEDFLHRKQDPALLEKDAGNQFRARVFPIEPNSDKQIILSYSEQLPHHGAPYRMLLAGLPTLRSLKADILVGGHSATGRSSEQASDSATGVRLEAQLTDGAPAGDLFVELPWRRQFALRSGNLVVARVQPVTELPPSTFEALTVLFDTSASRALAFGAQVERLAALLSGLRERRGEDFEVRVVAFDQQVAEVYRGPASGFDVRAQSKLITRAALGASDLHGALRWLAVHPTKHDRLLVVSDGIVTAGPDRDLQLREATAALAAHGVRRVDVLVEGGIHDAAKLGVITRAGLSEVGIVGRAAQATATLIDKLGRTTRERVAVNLAGATWVYPKELHGVQPGDEALIFAELPPGVPVQIELDGAGATALDTREAPAPLLERAWASAKIASLQQEAGDLGGDDQSRHGELRDQIVALSTIHRVLSEHTALLVLETESDYRRYGIARDALANILSVGDDGIEVVDRAGADGNDGDDGTGVLEIARLPQEQAAPQADMADTAFEVLAEARPDGELPKGAVFKRPPSRPRRAKGDFDLGALGLKDEEGSLAEALGNLGSIGSAGSARSAASGASTAKRRSRSKPKKSMPSSAPLAPSAPSAPEPASKPSSMARGSGGGPGDQGLGTAYGRGAGSFERTADIAVGPPRSRLRVRGAKGVAGVDGAMVRRLLQRRARPLQACHDRVLSENSDAAGSLDLQWQLDGRGRVTGASVAGGTFKSDALRRCVVAQLRRIAFPKPDAAQAGSLTVTLQFSVQLPPPGGSLPGAIAPTPSRPSRATRPKRPRKIRIPAPAIADALEGELAAVMTALAAGDVAGAETRAIAFRDRAPGDVTGLVALGEVFEAKKEWGRAARAYGSIIDLFPSRADMRRMAGARLARLPEHGATLSLDSYRRAVAQRPDHPSGYHALSLALASEQQYAEAFATLESALDRDWDTTRFEGVPRILQEDLGLIAAAWMRAQPAQSDAITRRLAARDVALPKKASTRFVLSWETDANDVDFHIYDGRGGHAYYMRKRLSSGGELYADITDGYGPECFRIAGRPRGYPYTLQAHYFARGPMGYGMGALQVIEHDGKGSLDIAVHPFVIMKDKAFLQLAELKGSLASSASRERP